jgi:hypothetical protein
VNQTVYIKYRTRSIKGGVKVKVKVKVKVLSVCTPLTHACIFSFSFFLFFTFVDFI